MEHFNQVMKKCNGFLLFNVIIYILTMNQYYILI